MNLLKKIKSIFWYEKKDEDGDLQQLFRENAIEIGARGPDIYADKIIAISKKMQR